MALGDEVADDQDVEWAGFRFSAKADLTTDAVWDSETEVTGLWLPSTRDTMQARTGSGGVSGTQNSDARTIEATNVAVYDLTTIRNLRTAMRPRQPVAEFVFQGFAGPSDDKMLVRARPGPEGMSAPYTDESHTDGIYLIDLQWVCDDPRIYSLEVFSETVNTSARTPDQIVNAGDEDAPWSFTVDGPCVNPRLRLAPDFGGNSFYYRGTVPSGKTLSVNSRTRTATIDGASVLGSCEGNTPDELHDWWLLPAGEEADVRFASDSGTSSVTFSWRNCWL